MLWHWLKDNHRTHNTTHSPPPPLPLHISANNNTSHPAKDRANNNTNQDPTTRARRAKERANIRDSTARRTQLLRHLTLPEHWDCCNKSFTINPQWYTSHSSLGSGLHPLALQKLKTHALHTFWWETDPACIQHFEQTFNINHTFMGDVWNIDIRELVDHNPSTCNSRHENTHYNSTPVQRPLQDPRQPSRSPRTRRVTLTTHGWHRMVYTPVDPRTPHRLPDGERSPARLDTRTVWRHHRPMGHNTHRPRRCRWTHGIKTQTVVEHYPMGTSPRDDLISNTLATDVDRTPSIHQTTQPDCRRPTT